MRGIHSAFDGAEGGYDRLATLAHLFRMLFKSFLGNLQNMLVFSVDKPRARLADDLCEIRQSSRDRVRAT